MKDSKNVIFPMTAGDLVQSAGVVTWRDDGGFGPELEIRRVKNITVDERHNPDLLHITFEYQGDCAEPLVLKRNSMVLVTDISRR